MKSDGVSTQSVPNNPTRRIVCITLTPKPYDFWCVPSAYDGAFRTPPLIRTRRQTETWSILTPFVFRFSSFYHACTAPAAYTLQLDNDNKAIRVTDSKVRARDLFLGHNELPKPGGPNPLKAAWSGGYAVEVFFFAASSLKITNLLR